MYVCLLLFISGKRGGQGTALVVHVVRRIVLLLMACVLKSLINSPFGVVANCRA